MASPARIGRLLAPVVLLAAATVASPARADNASCVSAAEEGQRDRGAGKLRSAAKKFVVCADPSCPVVVQRDCSKWAAEVSDATPTIVIDAHDGDNHDVLDVAVMIDGESIGSTLDGKAIPVDPGTHVIVGRRAKEGEEVSQTIVAKEGAKARPIRLAFRGSGSSLKVDVRAAAAPPQPTTESPSGHSIVPWVLMGVGGAVVIAGLVLFVTPPKLPSNCSETSKKCTKFPGESAADFEADSDQASRHTDQPMLGVIVGGVGLGIAAVGLVWHLLEPAETKKAKAARVVPWLGREGGGLTLTGTL